MMDWLIPIAAKSFVIAGGTLALLKLMKDRSAADRSWIAHLALAALLLLPVAHLALPKLDIVGPGFLAGGSEASSAIVASPATVEEAPLVAAAAAAEPSLGAGGAPVDLSFWGYAVPAILLSLFTLTALVRLFILKARANVLVDGPWLTALARAQHRMGFKHGTALLTSDELPSPISWGVVRPVILLNTAAAQSHDEAEAIITHELAHVAHLDWAKLLIARIATALFWFNPFVWLLAREAHQLREEAADDAVLATDIVDTDYARLLVGVARHECRGLLIGAHGVAPARNSLSRRVKRVLDGAVTRAPGGWRWGSAAGFFAAGMAVPVAALNIVPATSPDRLDPQTVEASQVRSVSAESPAIAKAAVETSNPATQMDGQSMEATVAAAVEAILAARMGGTTIKSGPDGKVMIQGSEGMIKVYPPDSKGLRKTVVVGADGGIHKFADASALPGLAALAAHPAAKAAKGNSTIDRAMALKSVGATPDYVAAIRSAAPHLRLDHDAIVGMRAVGVKPDFLRDLTMLGYRDLDGDDIIGAYAIGIRGDYIRSMAAAGYGRPSLEDLQALKSVGISAADLEKFRRAGIKKLDAQKMIEMKMTGLSPEELKAGEDFGP